MATSACITTRAVQWTNSAFRALRDNPVPTIPSVFRAAGYRTVALGKVWPTPNPQTDVWPSPWLMPCLGDARPR